MQLDSTRFENHFCLLFQETMEQHEARTADRCESGKGIYCELNYIECYWTAAKRYTREKCKYSFNELEPMVFGGFDHSLSLALALYK
jgi:hypothetical protein